MKYFFSTLLTTTAITCAVIAQQPDFIIDIPNSTLLPRTIVQIPPGVSKVKIDALGARGGDMDLTPFDGSFYSGGYGAQVSGEFTVTPGDTIEVLVGGKGANGDIEQGGGGGGGGTFVIYRSGGVATLLLAAAGGGGAGNGNGGGNGSSANGSDVAGIKTQFSSGGASYSFDAVGYVTDAIHLGAGATTVYDPAATGGYGGGGAGGTYFSQETGGGGSGYGGGDGGANVFDGGNGGSSYVNPVALNVYRGTADTTFDGLFAVTLLCTPVLTSLTDTICFGDTLVFGGQELTQAGFYFDTLTADNGCDSIITLSLFERPEISSNVSATVCDEGVYIFNQQILTSPGQYSATLTASNGCDSTVYLNLEFGFSNTNETFDTICNGDYKGFFGEELDQPGRYIELVPNQSGCLDTFILNLFVRPLAEGVDTVTICAGDTLFFEDLDITESGTYTVYEVSAAGCDSVIALTVNVLEELASSFTARICTFEVFNYNGLNYSQSGTYPVVLTAQNGCDSTVTFELIVSQPQSSSASASICQGGSFIIGNDTLTEQGFYSVVLQSSGGCDSTVSLFLSVTQPEPIFARDTICADETYLFGTQTLTASGTYFETFTAQSGCDSLVQLQLFERQPIISNVFERICDGESYPFNNQTLTESGEYNATFTSASGCDSTVNLFLSVVPIFSETIFDTICNGDTYDFFDEELTESGTYVHTSLSEGGCVDTVTLNLFVRPIAAGVLERTICAGDTLFYPDLEITESGTYTIYEVSTAGCDSVIALTVNVLQEIASSFTAQICTFDVYTYNGINYSQTGNYPLVFTAQNGCDSIVTLQLIVTNNQNSSVSASICRGNAYTIGDSVFTQQGFYTVVLQSVGGCDSTVSLFLSVTQPEPIFARDTICFGDTYTFGTQQLTQGGNFTETFTTQAGCDSIVQLQLFVRPDATSVLNETICAGSIYNFNNQALTQQGQYFANLTTINGCDSTITLNLDVLQNSASSITDTICNGTSYFFDQQQLTQSGIYTDTLSSANGCDSVITLNLTVRQALSSVINDTICEGGTYTYLDEPLTLPGTYNFPRLSVDGCDSLVTINLVVTPKVFGSFTETICAGQSYFFNNQTLTQGGSYNDTLVSAAQCDSIVTLQLIVLQSSASSFAQSICAGNSYFFNNQNLTQQGSYQDTIPNAAGCDSVITLELAVRPTAVTTLTESICAGSSFAFDNQNLTQDGVYTDTLQATNGCDSVVTLNLTVLPNAAYSFSQTICNGDTYTFFQQQLTQDGVYTDTLTSANGCDSVITLNLTVLPVYATSFNAAICDGVPYVYLNEPLYAAGSYTFNLTAVNGCDSTVTLNLSVGAKPKLNIASFLNPSCNGSSDGVLNVIAANGTSPYNFNINGGTYSLSTNFDSLAAGAYTLVVQDGNLCTDTLQTNLVQPAPVPSPTAVGDTVCAGGQATLQANGSGTIQWFDATDNLAGGGNSFTTGAINSTTTFSAANSINGCLSASVTVTVLVNNLPLINPAVTSNSPLCEQATLNLTAPQIANVTYSWNGPGNFTSAQQNPSIANVTEVNNQGFYTLVVTDNATGCTSLPSSVLVDISALPQNIVAASNSVCAGGDIELLASFVSGASYEWFGPAGFTSAVRNPIITNATAANSGTYSVIVSVGGCAAVPATVEVTVGGGSAVSAGNDTTITEGNLLTLNANGAFGYEWSPGAMLSNVSAPNPTAMLPVGEYEFIVRGISNAGCNSFDTVLVTVIKDTMPRAFDLITPNGDGQNERLYIPNIENLTGYTLKVYARGGGLVFETQQYNNDWNATLKGKELPDGVYFYILELADGTVLKGAVTVLRN